VVVVSVIVELGRSFKALAESGLAHAPYLKEYRRFNGRKALLVKGGRMVRFNFFISASGKLFSTFRELFKVRQQMQSRSVFLVDEDCLATDGEIKSQIYSDWQSMCVRL
jgi:hypothetical protein